MPAQLNSGIRSLHLVIPTPYDLSRTTDVRDDLIAVKVWYSTTTPFDPRIAGQGTLFSETNSLSITITGLETNKVYYVKYALISSIDPAEFTISKQYSAMTYDENTSIYGYLTNDPAALSTSSDGTGGNFAVTQGIFKLYSFSEDVTGKNDFTNGPFYSVVPGSAIGGLVATINQNTGAYSASAMTGNSGSIIFRATYKGLVVEKVFNVYKGIAGQTAPSIQLTTPIKEFIYKDVNQKRSTVASTTITATLKNLTGLVSWGTRAFSRAGVELGTQYGNQQIAYSVSADTKSITITNDQFSNPLDNNVDLGYVEVTATIGTTFETISIYRICDGSTQIQVQLSNQTHTITADENGGTDSLNYVGSGTTITVKKGAQTLLTDNVGTDADGFAADTWRVIEPTVGVNIVCDGSANIQPTYIEYDQHSAMTADAAYIDYTVRVQITNSTHQDFVVRQSFSKSKQGVRGNTARSVNLTYDALAFLTDNKTTPPTVTPPFMTFTATASNYTGAANYSWYVNPGTGYVQITGTGATTSIGLPTGNTFRLYPFPPGETRVVKVIVSENALSSFDEQGTVSQILGSDGLTAVIYNDTKAIICDQLGVPESGQLPWTTTFFVARGNVLLNSNPALVQFAKVSYTGGSDATYRIDQNSGLITIDSLNANYAEATFTATAGGLVITKKVSLTKYKDGKTPIKGTDYNDGSSIKVQYSQNANTWHDDYVLGDVFIRVNTIAANGTVTNGAAAKYIPEKGIGKDYNDGLPVYLHIKYSDDVVFTNNIGVAQSFTGANGEVPGDFIGTYTDNNPDDSSVKSLYTWARIRGAEGQKGPRSASGFLYYQISATSPPGPPSPTDTSWNWTTGTFSTPGANWSHSLFTPSAGQSAYAVRYNVTESAYGVTPVSVTLGSVVTSITFDGLVTFVDLSAKANTTDLTSGLSGKISTGNAATDINNNTTQILGGKITTGSIDANSLIIGPYNSNGSSRTGERVQMSNNTIKVFDAGGVVRVLIGNLLG
jgi:hypothetical protein